jgi:hypothetical protein
MSKGEVKSLNDLAMAHGGHLTINPHTGLPEAGFLQRMLPMIAGAALTATGVGSPLGVALMVGGGYAAATGSLKKGLMAGLGAYGGAGMAASFGEAGAASVVPEAAPVTPPVAPAPVVDAYPNPVTDAPTYYDSPFKGTTIDANNFARPDTVPGFGPNSAITPHTVVDAAGNVMPSTTPAMQGASTFNAGMPGNVPSVAPEGMYGQPPPAIPPTGQLPPAEPLPVRPAPVSTGGQYTGNFAPSSAPVSAANTGLGGTTNGYTPEVPTETSQFAQGAGGDEINAKFGTQNPSPDFKNMTPSQRFEAMKSGASFDNLGKWASDNKYQAYGMGASALMPWDEDPQQRTPYHDSDPGQQYTYEANPTGASNPDPRGRQQNYFNQRYVPRAAEGGFIAQFVKGHGQGQGQAGVPEGYSYDAGTQQYTKMATGGISDAQYNLGGYSDGGRLLRGPGDGVSDSIPAVIGKKQPARLADGEFVVPARIVSELGNGSTEAGARKLYAMMDRIQKTRGSTVGKGKVAKNSRADKYLPA